MTKKKGLTPIVTSIILLSITLIMAGALWYAFYIFQQPPQLNWTCAEWTIQYRYSFTRERGAERAEDEVGMLPIFFRTQNIYDECLLRIDNYTDYGGNVWFNYNASCILPFIEKELSGEEVAHFKEETACTREAAYCDGTPEECMNRYCFYPCEDMPYRNCVRPLCQDNKVTGFSCVEWKTSGAIDSADSNGICFHWSKTCTKSAIYREVKP